MCMFLESVGITENRRGSKSVCMCVYIHPTILCTCDAKVLTVTNKPAIGNLNVVISPYTPTKAASKRRLGIVA